MIATGTDTETYEVQPAPIEERPANPQPVHTLLLIENGIYLFESLYLEEWHGTGPRVPLRGAAAEDPRSDGIDGRSVGGL